ncbi:MAG: PAS domain-containing protein [Anaerolineae bacterium]
MQTYVDLQDETVAFLAGDIYGQNLVDLLDEFGVRYRTLEVDEYADVLNAVSSGDADVGVLDYLISGRLAPYYPSVEHTPMILNPIGLRFAVPKGSNAGILAALDAHLRLERLESESPYQRSLRHWVGGAAQGGWPFWATGLLLFLGGGGLLAAGMAIAFRTQVRARTADLAATNEALRAEIVRREETEQALRRSEAEWRSLVENAPDIVLLVDHEGTILFSNRVPPNLKLACADLPTSCLDYVADEYREMARRVIADAFTAGQVREHEVVTNSALGPPTWYATLVAPVARDGVVESVLVSLRDITDQRRAEQEIRLLARFPEEDPAPVLRVRADGALLYANPAAAPLLGMWNCQLSDLVPGAWRARVIAVLAGQTVALDEVEVGERTYALSLAPVPGEGCVNLYGLDVTERKRAEAMLAHEQYLMATLMANVPDMIYFKDSAARFLRISDSMARELGLSDPREAIGKWDLDYYPPEMARVFLEEDRSILAAETPMIDQEAMVRWPDGHESWVSTTAVAFTDAAGQVAGILGISRDLTQRRRLEEQLRQSHRLESVGRLAGGVAHDFNNLLTVINGSCDFLLASIGDTDPRRADVESVLRAGRRAAELTRQLLAFSRKQVLEMQVLDLNDVIKGMRRMIERVIAEDIHVHVVLPPDLHAVRCDPGQIEQVVMNLVVNACDAMPDGGELTLETQNVELDQVYAEQHAEVMVGEYVMLAVSDTGHGMTRDVMERLFEPFFTTKGKGQGTGLGLATVYGIVKQSGGHISVYSEPGVGSTFRIHLPRQADRPHRDVAGALPATPPSGGSETVLLVEDDNIVRDLAQRMLILLGYRVLVASGAQDAEAIARAGSEPIHLVLADVVLKDQSGPQAVAAVRFYRPQVRVLYMSGYTDNAIVHRGVLDPGIHLLSKPFTMGDLARRLREVLDGPTDVG